MLKFKKLASVYLIMLIIFLISMLIISIIPRNFIEENVRSSLEIFYNEGILPEKKFVTKCILDNYTDAVMLNTAYSIDEEEPIESLLLGRRNYSSKNLELIENGGEDAIGNLARTLDKTNTEYYQYGRYWHGYLVYLRPLLCIFTYENIRIILVTTLMISLIILSVLIYKKIDILTAVLFILSSILISYHMLGLSIQYFSVFIIAIVSSIIIMVKNNIKDINILFFILGGITVFFDLLTTPIVSCGIPLLFYILIKSKEEKISIKEYIKIIFYNLIYFAIGYGILWISKWLICDLICNSNIFYNAVKQTLFYTGLDNENNATILNVWGQNISYIKPGIITFLGLFVITTIINYKKNTIKKNLPYIIVALIPLVWYVITKNHAYIHARFTYRGLYITLFAIGIMISNNIKLKIGDFKICKK